MSSAPTALFLAGMSDRAIVACARSLREAGYPFRISLPENGEHVAWRRTEYKNHVLPERYPDVGDTAAFRQFLTRATEPFGRTILYPTSDSMARELSRQKQWLADHDIAFPIPEFETYTKLSDKEPLAELADSYGIGVPERFPSMPTESDIPFVAKPRRNVDENGDYLGVVLVEDESTYRRFEDDFDESLYFFQERIKGESRYFCALYEDGEVIDQISQKTVLQQPGGGSVVKARPATLPTELTDKFSRMMAELDWTGPLMVEFKRSESGFDIIEVNARFWGPLQLCVDNEANLPKQLYRIYTDEPIETRSKNGRIGYLRTNAYVQGLWFTVLKDGRFERHSTAEDDEYEYRDVWLRKDTAEIFVRENVKMIGLPIYHLVKQARGIL